MRTHRRSKKSDRHAEAGQAILFLVLVLGIVLLGVIAFAVDMGNLWFQRQEAQTVADASCTAAAMDMLAGATGGTNGGGFTPPTAFSCSSSPSAAPCLYAKYNMGYAPSTVTAGTAGYDVSVSFPGSVAGLPSCSTGKNAPTICNASSYTANPFVQTNVNNQVPTYFSGLLSGKTTTAVGAQAVCGLVFSSAPIPILVLNPLWSGTLNLGGTGNAAKITIYGGPQRSVQVDSSNSAAVTANGNPKVDLTQGGPNLTGSNFGVTGGPNSVPFVLPSPGTYSSPTASISDPFATLPVPSKPAAAPSVTTATSTTDPGCPAGTTCYVYSPGYYSSGICVGKGSCTNKTYTTAIFLPGAYYLDGDFKADSNSCLRPSAQVGDGSGGTFFYFNTGTLNVDSNSGSSCPAAISTTVGVGSGDLQYAVKCTSNSQIPANLPASITGNLLMGPCTGSYGDPLLTDDPMGEQHGIVFFGNRSNKNEQPAWGGGGTAALLGSLYFHDCSSTDGSGLGSNCAAPSATSSSSSSYSDNVTLQGNPGSTSYVIGNIVTDQLSLGGTPAIYMDLNPNALYYVLKASLLQ